MNKCANEFPEENEKSNHSEAMAIDTGRHVATKQKEQSTPPLSSLLTIVVPIDQRKWRDILASDTDNVGEGALTTVSLPMTRLLRHRGLHRETDGAMEWNILVPMSCLHHLAENNYRNVWCRFNFVEVM